MDQGIQDSEMSVRASSCSPCRITYKCSTCDYTSELYHEMCTHVMQAYFEEKDAPFKCSVCGIYKATQVAFCTHYRQTSPWAPGSVCLPKTSCPGILCKGDGSRDCPDAPSYEEVRADALECPGCQVDQCSWQQDVVDLHADG